MLGDGSSDLSILSSVAMIFLLMLLTLGVGTSTVVAQEPVEISNATELQDVRDDLDADYVLVEDIDLSGLENFEPIGDREEPFGGTFDGDGHTISNLTVHRPREDNVGFFSVVDGSIENISLEDVKITGRINVGTLVGLGYGVRVQGSHATGEVKGKEYVGGLVGRGGIRESHSKVDVEGGKSVGGLVGYGGVHESHSEGDVEGNENVGGLVGYTKEDEIRESHSTGDVNGNRNVGGLVGHSDDSNFQQSYSTGNVTGNYAVGGLVGMKLGERGDDIHESYATGDVEGGTRVGGLVGMDWGIGNITGSYATGDVTGSWLVGGLVGWNPDERIIDSYAEGDVEGHAEVGGLIGWNAGEVRKSHFEGEVAGDARVGVLVGELGRGSILEDPESKAGSLVDSYWMVENPEGKSVPAVGVRKPETEFENVTPDTVGEGGSDVVRPPPSEPGGEVWTFETDGETESSPTVVDGTAYVGVAGGKFYAVNTEDGMQEWTHQTQEDASISSPTVTGGVAYIRDSNGTVYALDASGGFVISGGPVIWKFETGVEYHTTHSPTVYNGTVYVGEIGGELYALNASTGQEEWSFSANISRHSSPTVVDGTVYVGGLNKVYAINSSTGNEKWAFEDEDGGVSKEGRKADDASYTSPTVTNGTVYITASANPEFDGATLDPNVYAIDASNGTKEWAFGATLQPSSPTVAGGVVYIRTELGDVYAINSSTGKKEWLYQARGGNSGITFLGASSSPTVADGKIYVGGGKYLYALNASTGKEWWVFEGEGSTRTRFHPETVFNSAPTVVNGTVYISSRGGNLYAVNAGVSGSSEGSRVLLGTLGHHHTWAEKQSKYINVESGLPLPAVVGVVVLIIALVGGALLRRRTERE
jgi:outer membrane protein assembly factor BamB